MVSLVARVDTTHRDMIHDAQMDYYGTRLATCSSDRSVRIFEVRNNGQTHPLAELQGHEGPVWQVCWSHPMYESLLATCSYDHKVIIWKEVSGKWTKLYEHAHDASVNSICWAPHQAGLSLACGSTDKSISIISYNSSGDWEVKCIKDAHDHGCNAVSWSPAMSPGTIVNPSNPPTPIQPRVVSGGNDFHVKIWRECDNGEWTMEHDLEGHRDWVRDVAWAPSVALPYATIASCSQDKRVIIWRNDDLSSGKWKPHILHTFDDVVWHVSWSQCGSILAVSGGDNKVSLWKENLQGEWTCLSEPQKTTEKS